MLYSLMSQTNEDWGAHVIIDNPEDKVICSIAESFDDPRIRWTKLPERHNNWGHTPREIGKQLSEAEYIIMSGDDNYYTPNFVSEIHQASAENPGLIYWDMVHSHYGYSHFVCSPAFNQIDMGAFATRRDLAQSIKLNTTFAADGEYVEAFKVQYPREPIHKIPKILFVHN